MTTADQEAWTEVAQAIRAQLCKCAADMPAMNPGELKEFVEAAQAAYWLEVNAQSFDQKVDLENRKLFADQE